MELDQLIGAYWQHYRLEHEAGEVGTVHDTAYEWASELIDGVAARTETGMRWEVPPVELMLKLAAHAPDDQALAHLGAGPVESYLRCGTVDVDALDAAAGQSERFRTALRYARFEDHLSAKDSQRLRRFGSPL